MALRQLGKVWAGIATGAVATSAAHCAEQDKYFDPEALERGAKVRFTLYSVAHINLDHVITIQIIEDLPFWRPVPFLINNIAVCLHSRFRRPSS